MPCRPKGECGDAPARERQANVGNDKDDDVNEGVSSNEGDKWLGIAMAVVLDIGGEKGSGEAIINSFVSMVMS